MSSEAENDLAAKIVRVQAVIKSTTAYLKDNMNSATAVSQAAQRLRILHAQLVTLEDTLTRSKTQAGKIERYYV